MRQKGFTPILILVILAVASMVAIYYLTIKKKYVIPPPLQPTPTESANNPDQITTFFKPQTTPVPTHEPTPTQRTRSFEDEEKLMRKTLAGFEMYIGASNTAGALSFFTSPISITAKQRYEEIRIKNLPYRLTSWSFIMDVNGMLLVEEIKNGYRVRINECRTNNTSCSLLFLELVRNEEAENGFSVDRYYTNAYSYQNNLGEEIKYQGFDL